jgi:hypothetical protein
MGYIKTAVDALQNFNRVYAQEIYDAVYQNLVMIKYMTPTPGVSDEHIATAGVMDEVIQGYQKAFTPKGDLTLTPYKTKVRPIKIDLKIEELEKLRQTYLAKMFREGRGKKDYQEMDFIKYILTVHLPKAIANDMEIVSCVGTYVAPTAGTAGDAVNATDGILTGIATAIDDGDLAGGNVITTGALTTTNILDKVELFVDALPAKMKTMNLLEGQEIFMSFSLYEAYKRKYAEKYGTYMDYKTGIEMVYGTSMKVVGIPGWGSSDALLCTPKTNLLHCYNEVDIPTEFNFEVRERAISVYADFSAGFGFNYLQDIYVNDQAA